MDCCGLLTSKRKFDMLSCVSFSYNAFISIFSGNGVTNCFLGFLVGEHSSGEGSFERDGPTLKETVTIRSKRYLQLIIHCYIQISSSNMYFHHVR